jgi:hypothetical protein
VETSASRFVDLVGAYNFRDLGGLPTIAGRPTRRGAIFRSDALHHLEPSGVDRLLELGVRTVVDLRSSVEVDRTGRGLLGREKLAWLHAPLTTASGAGNVLPPALAAGDLGAHYRDSLDERTEMLARVIEHLSDAANLPAVFHCTAGKDRTGVVAALVLSLVGVGADAIVEDYALTEDRMALIMERLRLTGDFPETTETVMVGLARAEATSMRTFLDALERGYGGARGWARGAGISDATIASLRRLLVG